MKVTRNPQGNVQVELEDDQEVVLLWAIAAKVGGSLQGPRRLLSNHDPRAPGLFQSLTPFVQTSRSVRAHFDSKAGAPRASAQDVMAGLFGSMLCGQLALLPHPGDAGVSIPHLNDANSDTALPV